MDQLFSIPGIEFADIVFILQAISESSARTLGCVIVDILTLDTLYNDVHWQDPDFRKVTTERLDLVTLHLI